MNLQFNRCAAIDTETSRTHNTAYSISTQASTYFECTVVQDSSIVQQGNFLKEVTVGLYTFFNSGVSSEGASIASLHSIVCSGVFPTMSCVLTPAPYPTSRSTTLL